MILACPLLLSPSLPLYRTAHLRPTQQFFHPRSPATLPVRLGRASFTHPAPVAKLLIPCGSGAPLAKKFNKGILEVRRPPRKPAWKGCEAGVSWEMLRLLETEDRGRTRGSGHSPRRWGSILSAWEPPCWTPCQPPTAPILPLHSPALGDSVEAVAEHALRTQTRRSWGQ